MKRLVLFLIFAWIAADANAQANVHRTFEINWNVLSYSSQSELSQYGGTLDFALHLNRRWALVVDAGVHQPAETLFDVRTTTVRLGPRLSQAHGDRITTFAQVLAGAARLSGRGNTISTADYLSGFAVYGGGGVDVGIRPWFAWRAIEGGYSGFDIDGWSHGYRISTGLVFRFGKYE
jgi:hypothetical protein